MARIDQSDQSAGVDMGVDLGRGDVGMAEHRLEGAQVRAAFEQMSRKGVAQLMRAHARRIDASFGRQRAHELEEAHTAQIALARREEPGAAFRDMPAPCRNGARVRDPRSARAARAPPLPRRIR